MMASELHLIEIPEAVIKTEMSRGRITTTINYLPWPPHRRI